MPEVTFNRESIVSRLRYLIAEGFNAVVFDPNAKKMIGADSRELSSCTAMTWCRLNPQHGQPCEDAIRMAEQFYQQCS